ncbi:MAG: hypothetical protein HY869_01415 [Chloroflexi bacterium]|nr:hypothetical protein [Chloroflexota bacterium]
MKRRNPLLAGLFNVLVPGSSHLYVDNNWLKFIQFFIGGAFAITVAVVIGNNIQRLAEYTLPQGICTGSLLLVIFALLFYNGMQAARARNSQTDSAAYYKSRRLVSNDDMATRMEKLLKKRTEGLISKEQYDSEKTEIETKE